MWNWFAAFWNQVERTRLRDISRELHEILYHVGYQHQISFYGTLKETYDGRHTQARIELLSKTPFTVADILRYREKFRHFRPDREYTLIAVECDSFKEVVVE